MSLLKRLHRHEPAVLALADGSVFKGISIGHSGETTGEVVFNTAITGYQEILTDPSYSHQLVALTYPHIGNVGVNENDQESDRVHAAGLIIRELSPIVSNWRASGDLSNYLKQQHIVAIAEIDTRRLTHLLRDKGAQSGCIMTGDVDSSLAIAKARAFSGLDGLDLATVVTTKKISNWQQGSINIHQSPTQPTMKYHVVVYDYGVKRQMLNLLYDRGCRLTIVPANTSANEVIALKPDGVLLSNGPGDPSACGYAIDAISQLLQKQMPLFGICLGFQLLALACGAKTIKMKFGHHGANHPVIELASQRVLITSQNHGFAVDSQSLPSDLTITHRSLFDDTIQGIAHRDKPAFAFQGHPEASPGPHDAEDLFDQFVQIMQTHKQTVKLPTTEKEQVK